MDLETKIPGLGVLIVIGRPLFPDLGNISIHTTHSPINIYVKPQIHADISSFNLQPLYLSPFPYQDLSSLTVRSLVPIILSTLID